MQTSLHKITARSFMTELKNAIRSCSMEHIFLCLYRLGVVLNDYEHVEYCRVILNKIAYLYPELIQYLAAPHQAIDVIAASRKLEVEGVWGYIGDALLEVNVAYINNVGCNCGQRVELVFGGQHRHHRVIKEWLGKHLLSQDQRDQALMLLCGKINKLTLTSPFEFMCIVGHSGRIQPEKARPALG